MSTPTPGPSDLLAEGPSFPLLVKVLASALVLALLVGGARVSAKMADTDMGWSAYALFFGGLVLVLGSYLTILRSRTAISPTHIRQFGLWTREVALTDVSQAKLIYIPMLRWLIAPRLMVRVRGRGLYTFYTADPEVLAYMRHLGLGQAMQPGDGMR